MRKNDETFNEIVRSSIKYDRKSGDFYNIKSGKKYARTTTYIYIKEIGAAITKTRIAMFLVRGQWPQRRIVRVDGDITNYRYDNLYMPEFTEVTPERLKKMFSYNPITGTLTSKIPSKQIPAGTPVGTSTKRGYITVKIEQKVYKVHRIAFAIMKGRWPTPTVDHINRNKSDNRWCNLREASYSEQSKNHPIHKITSKCNKYGVAGVSWLPRLKKWQVTIAGIGVKKQMYLGMYSSLNEAVSVRLKAEKLRAKERIRIEEETRKETNETAY